MGVEVKWVGKWMSEYGEGCIEQVKQFFMLTDCPLMCEERSSSYGQRTSLDLGDIGETCEEAVLPHSRHGGFWFCINVGSHQWVRYKEYVTCIWTRRAHARNNVIRINNGSKAKKLQELILYNRCYIMVASMRD